MKHIALFVLFLIIVGLACGGQPSAEIPTPPNTDHLVEFNEAGVAVLHGYPSAGHYSSTENVMIIEIPVNVEGMQSVVAIPFNIDLETEISSSRVPNTTVHEYLNSHSGATPSDVFPSVAQVEVTFLKKGTAFEATSIYEIEQEFIEIQKQPAIEHLFSTDESSQKNMLIGHIDQAYSEEDGTVIWLVSVPISIQGVAATVILTIYSAADTQVNTLDGVVSAKDFYWGNVQIQFTRSGDKVIAYQVTELR